MATDTLQELKLRRALCQRAIKLVSGIDDSRREDALAEYNRQLNEIDNRIKDLTGSMPTRTIGLQPMVLGVQLLTKE